MEYREGNVFTGICHSVCLFLTCIIGHVTRGESVLWGGGGGGVCINAINADRNAKVRIRDDVSRKMETVHLAFFQ